MTSDDEALPTGDENAAWILFADRQHGRIMLFAKYGDRWYDTTTYHDETPSSAPSPSDVDDEAMSPVPVSIRVWRDDKGNVIAAEAIIEDYADYPQEEQSRLLGFAASRMFETLFEGDMFLMGPLTLWGDLELDEGGFLTYTTGTPQTRAQRERAAKEGLESAVDRARRNAARRRRARAR